MAVPGSSANVCVIAYSAPLGSVAHWDPQKIR
jgi:hypothetical protein